MNKVLLRWILPTSALLLFGPIAAAPVRALRDPMGGPDATLILSSAPVLGVLAALLIVAIAGMGGAITARLTAPGTGRTFAGLTVVWAAMVTGDSWRILMVRGGSAVVPLAIEGVIVAVLGACAAVALMLGGGSHEKSSLRDDLKGALGSGTAGLGLLVGIIGGGIGAYLVAIDGGRGQGLMGGILGGVLAAVGVQLAAANLPPEQARLRATASLLLLMILSPLSLIVMPGAGSIADAARSGTLFGPGIIQPLDWLAGVFLGVPAGMAWFGSVAERAQPKPSKTSPART